MDKQPLQKLQQQSQEEFRQQFNPNSETYHKGSQVPVPTGGDRIPENMASMYPEGFDPNKAPEVIDYGEGYKKVQKDRAVYQNLKKSLAKLGPVLEAFLRHEDLFKQKGDPTNEKHVKTHEENMKKQQTNLENVQKQLEAYLPQLEEIGEDGQILAKELKVIIVDSNKKYSTKEALTDFNFKVKKVSANSFSNAQKCLQKLKQIKKAVEAKKKEEKEETKAVEEVNKLAVDEKKE